MHKLQKLTTVSIKTKILFYKSIITHCIYPAKLCTVKAGTFSVRVFYKADLFASSRNSHFDEMKDNYILVQGTFFSGYVHTIPDSFCTGTKPHLKGLLFTHKNSDFGAISVKERSCAALISKLESHISDRC